MTPGAARAIYLGGKEYIRILYKFPPPGAKLYKNTTYLSPLSRRGPTM